MGGKPSVPDDQLPPERTFIVTGANTGIGYMTTKTIAQLGGRVIMACRSEQKATDAIQRMKQETQEDFKGSKGSNGIPELNIQYMNLDLSSLESTINFARQFKETGLPLHVLICNAGLLGPQKKALTDDGFELHFQVNYLSHFLLTLLLLPLLKESAPNSRIVNVSSEGHKHSEVKLSNIQGQKSYSVTKFYGNSKLFQIMNMYSLSRRLTGHDISVFSLHPGFVETDIFRTTSGATKCCVDCCLVIASKDTSEGSKTSLIAALDEKYNGKTALYFKGGKPSGHSGLSRNEAKQDNMAIQSTVLEGEADRRHLAGSWRKTG
ncbi:putative retinol dehydrogenase 12 [Apostichopus japonicus]|uniref:Putative retinol dehydrogenase 12 n=1 Tax=Stichopus japonicus TaxID=307972 RepID=A0A2G8K0H6_STIJA|nr:putative retinol dehydrogenase 12 [Apostichopus japonicus]